MTGLSVSRTVTVNEHVAWLPDASVAVQFTVVVPGGKVEPDGGLQTTFTPGQLSVEPGANATAADAFPGSLPTTMLVGQVIFGGSESLTVTVNEQHRGWQRTRKSVGR